MFAVVISDYDDDLYIVSKPYDMDDLKFLQSLVEGLIERVELTDYDEALDMYVNEEGLFDDTFSHNILASEMCHRYIVGPAVLIRSTPDGDTRSIDDEDLVRWQLDIENKMSLHDYVEMRRLVLSQMKDDSNVNDD
jgi:hypothetical protein